MFTKTAKLFLATATVALGLGSAGTALAAPVNLLPTSSVNPATGNPWAEGDAYHMLFITSTTTTATSTSIADYNAFVQADAVSNGLGAVSWFALASTTSVDAVDNVSITGPVINKFDSVAIAVDASDLWDFQFTESRTDLAGNLRNVWTGSTGGGVADANDELGADDGGARRHWSGWTDWVAANNNQPTSSEQYMIGISEELTIPEPGSLALLGVGGLLVAARRRA